MDDAQRGISIETHRLRLLSGTETGSMSMKEESKTSPRRLLLPQLIVALVCGLGTIICGLCTGHSAVLLPRLQQNDSTIPIDDEIGSWIASISSIGIPIGNIVGGTLADKLGRRKMFRVTQILFILGWILLATAQSYQMIIATRFILGMGRGMVVDAILILLDEHADAGMRAILYLHVGAFMVVGILIITGIGTVLDWRTTAGVATIFPIGVFFATWAVPESPIWLIRNGKFDTARRILEKAWGKDHKEQARRELKIMTKRCQKDGDVFLKMFLRPHVIKSFIIVFLLIMLQVSTGTHVFVFYSVDIFARARQGSKDLLDEYAITNIAGFLRIAMVLIMAWFSIKIKRRTIVLTSAIVSGVCLLFIGTTITVNLTSKLLTQRAQSWLLLSLIFVYIIASTVGMYFLPTLLVGELLPSKIRGLASGLVYAINELVLGVVLKNYPLIWERMGIQGMFWLFGFFCILFALYVFLFIPETHNRTLVQMEEYFQGHNILWQSRTKGIQSREVTSTEFIESTECVENKWQHFNKPSVTNESEDQC